jgi:hypothetical protein
VKILMVVHSHMDCGKELPAGQPELDAGGLDAIPCCLVEEVPRIAPEDAPAADPTLPKRRAALVASYLAGDDVLVSWSRAEAAASIRVIVGGHSMTGMRGGPGAPLAVNLPPGASGTAIGGIRGQLGQLTHWVPIAAQLAAVDPRRSEAEQWRRQPARIEDVVSAVWQESFSWLVWATPVEDAAIEPMLSALEQLPAFLRAQSSGSEASASRAARMEARHRELESCRLDGLWRIRALVGHDSPEMARRLAALLCAAVDVAELPYALRPGAVSSGLDAALERGDPDDDLADLDRGTWPIRGSTDLLAALAFTPRAELPGIRLRVPSTFDLTPESDGEIELGSILTPTHGEAGPLSVSRETLKRHTFVCGATGSGKSQTIRGMLERLSRAEPAVPWLVIEPAKAEYRMMAGRLRDSRHEVLCVRPGEVERVPVGLNPLEPERGFPLQTHVDLVRALFLASFRSEEPFPQVMTSALTRCYEEQGWDLVLGESRVPGVKARYPRLADLQRIARQVVTSIGYGREVTQDVRGFIDVRLSSLRLGTAGRFLGDGQPLDLPGLLSANVVLELEDVGDDQEKAFLMGLVIIRLYEHLRVTDGSAQVRPGEIRHVTVIEEAHRLLRRPDGFGQVAHAVELFANLLAEVRAYGEGIIVAEQIPEKIIPDVIKNTAIKVIHRLPARDDREAVGATMNLTEAQSEYIVGLRPGEAAVFSEPMDLPVLVRMELGQARESDEQLGRELPLAGRMSAACGAECRRSPCTLREARRAQRLLEEEPSITVWTELVVVSHLLGFPAPEAGARLRAALGSLDRRGLECVLSHAAQHGVASRSGAIARHFSPDELTSRVAAVMQAQLDSSPIASGPPREHWLVGPYRWEHVRKALWDWGEEGTRADAPTHPDTARWKALLDLDLGVATDCAEQMRALKRIIERQGTPRAAVLFGLEEPSALEWAVGATRSEARWPRALKEAVTNMADREYVWPAARFAPQHVNGGEGG